MSKAAKAWLIAAAVLTALGLLLFAGVMTACDWNFTRLDTGAYTTTTYAVTGKFAHIAIRVNTAQVEFLPAADGNCRVVCFEPEKVQHTATVENDTLTIDTVDTRKWYEYISVSFGSPKMTVYLPEAAYASLQIETDTGNIRIPADFSFGSLKIHGDTADVDCLAAAANSIEIHLSTGHILVDNTAGGRLDLATTTGNVRLNAVAAPDAVHIQTDTGTVKCADIACTEFAAESDTGNMTLHGVVASDSISVKSDTGNVRFEDSDAFRLSVKTGTGNVTGTLLSEKVFITETGTGTVSVPKTAAGGRCEITTGTGNIKITITETPS